MLFLDAEHRQGRAAQKRVQREEKCGVRPSARQYVVLNPGHHEPDEREGQHRPPRVATTHATAQLVGPK
ncbi:hypothetical protein MSIMFI_00403 [Mycobacterium simulans]|uniref:hypothetical protein n=1 Tax=Mycobacterium simulans TaxID=627089 RepID=UPI001749F3BD|nr:hypothetical protein [Mycobacterium simulans]SON58922.1 hypothetical protein MSIMFI_00403 [Mycobacterium simulans]